MQIGQTEVCTDIKPPPNLSNMRHNHGHNTAHHNNQHLHGVLIGSMQGYGNNLIETFKTEALCQIQCMDCQKVIDSSWFVGLPLLLIKIDWLIRALCDCFCVCVCLQYFNSEEMMTAHRLIHHDQSNDSTSMNNSAKSNNGSDKVYECDVCLKTFNKHSSWWKHKKCHTGERAYKCYICSKSFTQQANLHRVRDIWKFGRLHHPKWAKLTRECFVCWLL